MAYPFKSWPGADGLLTTNMWAWRFGTRPAFLGPVHVKTQEEIEEERRLRLSLGQGFFSMPPTPPPCAAGYLPVLNRGVLMCIHGSPGSAMIGPGGPGGAATRSFPVGPFYGWERW